MKSTKTFNEMCGYIHELLTSLGYTYKLNSGLFRYYLGDKELFNIYNNDIDKSIWEKVNFDSLWFQVNTNEDDEYEPYYINELTDLANKFVKLYKQTKVDSRRKEIEKDFQDG